MRTSGSVVALLSAFITGLAACEAPPVPESADPSSIMEPDGEADPLTMFMGTREERAARAPYSPPGWPLQRGHAGTWREREDLHARFGIWDEVRAPFWVDDMVFGAHWVSGYDENGRYSIIYVGHYPERTDWFWPPRDDLPPHLRDRDLDELKESLYGISQIMMTREMLEEMIRDPAFAPHGHSGAYARFVRDRLDTWTEEAWLDGFTGEAGSTR